MDHASVWRSRAKHLLRAELKRRKVTQAELAMRLGTIGVNIAPQSVYNRISRGTFSAVFLLQCLAAIGADRIGLDQHELCDNPDDPASRAPVA